MFYDVFYCIDIPETPFCITTVKLLIECATTKNELAEVRFQI